MTMNNDTFEENVSVGEANADSRKRPLESEVSSDDMDNASSKRSNFGAVVPSSTEGLDLLGDGIYHMKILIPSLVAGSIIGKGGETIGQLQKDTNTKIKMSKANDFYPGYIYPTSPHAKRAQESSAQCGVLKVIPCESLEQSPNGRGTSERVCIISGSPDSIMEALIFIIGKIKEKPDPNAKPAIDFDNKLAVDRDKQMKILVPNSTAGMIIGKGGSYIKQIKEETGAYVQISQKAKDTTLLERCITVIGEGETSEKACAMILTKIVEDPQSGSCLNVSYADVSGPVANFNPTGSPFAVSTATSSSPGNGSYGSNIVNALAGGLNFSLNLGPVGTAPLNNSTMMSQIMDHVRSTLRGSGYTEQATHDIVSSLNTLANYGILGVGMGMGIAPISTSTSSSTIQPPASESAIAPHSAVANPVSGAVAPISMVSTDAASDVPPLTTSYAMRYTTAFDPFSTQSSPASAITGSPILHTNSNSYGLGTTGTPVTNSPIMNPNQVSKSVEVSENIVGAILGPGGTALVEIQRYSGATIQITKKGIFAPGTRNRVVTITGTPEAINTAHCLIQQRITKEEEKRKIQNYLRV
ncbi:unnamed protein product [Darwinula stevensoni]|uniref:K Homology domain-containing protein n=1 Tax=Darwinula stevensoni TaxID=69355 RepID=A0A7R8X780_9CRUS|nr:unnamed protein product [Darwinula stevensoni]CAG0886594.1 unnamed protein product [Darwinula stevensoni]